MNQNTYLIWKANFGLCLKVTFTLNGLCEKRMNGILLCDIESEVSLRRMA